MKTFFEYFYYRIAKMNFTKNYERATISVTTVQFVIIINLYSFFIIGPFEIKRKLLPGEQLIFLVIFFTIEYFNGKLYKGRFEDFDKKWGHESKKEKIFGMVKVMSFIVFCFILFFINGWIYDRFK